jgi:hypothetical protein
MCKPCRAAFDDERTKRHRINTTVLCACGCGNPTKIAQRDWPEKGHVKGEPLRFLKGHNARKEPYPETPYIVDPETGCWIWQLSLDDDGYGRLCRPEGSNRAHRVYYEEKFGPLPDGMVPDHACPHGPNRACVNPDHMEPKTVEENSRWKSSTKLTWQDVAMIRLLALQGVPQVEIGRRFNVNQSHIWKIVHGERWVA